MYQQQWGRREIHTGFWWEKPKERNNLEELGKQTHNTSFSRCHQMKTTELRNSTSITFHWVKGHAGPLADYLAKTAACYNTAIAYDAMQINRGMQILEE